MTAIKSISLAKGPMRVRVQLGVTTNRNAQSAEVLKNLNRIELAWIKSIGIINSYKADQEEYWSLTKKAAGFVRIPEAF